MLSTPYKSPFSYVFSSIIWFIYDVTLSYLLSSFFFFLIYFNTFLISLFHSSISKTSIEYHNFKGTRGSSLSFLNICSNIKYKKKNNWIHSKFHSSFCITLKVFKYHKLPCDKFFFILNNFFFIYIFLVCDWMSVPKNFSHKKV